MVAFVASVAFVTSVTLPCGQQKLLYHTSVMASHVLHEQIEKYQRKVPTLVPGNTVRVHERVQEGEKERTQIFEGLIIGMHKGHVPTDRSFTVRKVVSGIGVEKVFPLHSPMLQKVQVTKEAKVRRAKLNFLRGRSGKAERLHQRFTKEFGDVVVPAVQEKEEVTPVTPSVEKKAE